jgi:hypothetical protein
MVSYLDPNQEAYFVDDGDETRAFQAEEDDVNDPMLMGNAALMNPSLYARDDFTGTSGIAYISRSCALVFKTALNCLLALQVALRSTAQQNNGSTACRYTIY